MAEYLVRVELFRAEGDEYRELHEKMELLGLKRTVTYGDGSVRRLPIGTYFGSSNLDLNEVRDRVKTISTPLSPPNGPSIIVAESKNWAAFLPLA
ncbi:hypothetical protein HU718_016670 [Pseudomonas tensinigenes]|uniref:DUF2622 domain-containing protein n=1 Tax=Pseudomonas tensinigenes TaxID=2745511 RepID=A0ABX8PQW5_9PSED|nr:hypothetical protein [Pseudomonas tensinigenes]QXI03671.1 hypothetical protein HU718_016670 [Pseudomonas tensinigenes]